MTETRRASVIAALIVTCGAMTACSSAGDGEIHRLAPAFDALVPPDARIEKLAGDFGFIEGPLWFDEDGGYLLFSDVPGNRIIKWTDQRGAETFLEPVLAADADTGASGGSNGLARDPAGRLLIAEHGNRRIARLEADLSRTTLVDSYDGKRFNSPNDLVVHSDGSIYFTDPTFGLPMRDLDPARELDVNGIYRLSTTGELRLLASQSMPNGLAFSPDERTLYVSNTHDDDVSVRAYPVRADGTLGEAALFHTWSEGLEDGFPDGMKVDDSGNLWATGPGGVLVLDSEGQHLGTIRPDQMPFNLAFGDFGKSLYITAASGLYRLNLGSARK